MSEKIPYTQVARRITSDIDYIMEEAYLQGKKQGFRDGSIDVKERVGEAYQKGYDEAKLIYQNPNAEFDYQRGLDDAWVCARKIVTWPDRSLVKSDAFDLDPGENIFTKYSAYRAIEKLKAYEEQQKADEIKVGDEVTPKSNDSNWLGVVVGVDDTNAMVMTRDGYTAMYRLEILKKTDKHFSQVAELLKAMNGEQRNCSACEHDGDPRFCDPCRHNDMWQPKEVTE